MRGRGRAGGGGAGSWSSRTPARPRSRPPRCGNRLHPRPLPSLALAISTWSHTECSVSDMDVARYLDARAELVNRALAAHFPASRTRLRQAIRYSLLAGGKRIRPILTLAAAEVVGAPARLALPFACALEMIHTYSLVHDDLPAMDDDDLRRGRPTNHRVYGEGLAILVGDALLTEAFHAIAT